MENSKIKKHSSLVTECIKTALILLAKEKSIYSITISELCIKAGVSRMSFYRNYTSIDDVIEKNISAMFLSYIDSVERLKKGDGVEKKRQHIENYFSFMYENRDFIDMLIAYGIDTIFLKKQTEYMVDRYKDTETFLSMSAFAGAVYNLYRVWSESGYTIPKEDIINTLT